MSREQLPKPWQTAMERKGIDSIRGLAARAGISPQTAKRLIDGTGRPSYDTVVAVAKVLFDGQNSGVYELLRDPRQDHGPWELPQDVVSQLDEEQRAAVLAVARAMLPAEVRKGGDDGGDTTATKKAVPMSKRDRMREVGLIAARDEDSTALD